MMEKQHLYVSWRSKPPLEGINIYHVNGDIEYDNGKLVFTISNGSRVKIDPEQIVTIGITKTNEQLNEMIEEIRSRHQ